MDGFLCNYWEENIVYLVILVWSKISVHSWTSQLDMSLFLKYLIVLYDDEMWLIVRIDEGCQKTLNIIFAYMYLRWVHVVNFGVHLIVWALKYFSPGWVKKLFYDSYYGSCCLSEANNGSASLVYVYFTIVQYFEHILYIGFHTLHTGVCQST